MSSLVITALDEDVDLVHFAGENGVLFESESSGIAGRGELCRMDIAYQRSAGDASLAHALQQVQNKLNEMLEYSSTGAGVPVAIVSVPFAPTLPVCAIVPRYWVRRRVGGGTTLTCLASDADHVEKLVKSVNVHEYEFPNPTEFSVWPTRSPKQWCDSVNEAIHVLQAGELEKVVLARDLNVQADETFSAVRALERLRESDPRSFRYLIDGFLGASPELLISRQGQVIASEPMAGTTSRRSAAHADAELRSGLTSSHKNAIEHKYVVDVVRGVLSAFCKNLDVPASPSIVSLAKVHHLATQIMGELSDPTTGVLELVDALHPTPAVGGKPLNAALTLIDRIEELDRGRYAGAVGWVDAHGNGSFAVAIRCAQLRGNRAVLCAGAGIVSGSDADAELEETKAKFETMLGALIRP